MARVLKLMWGSEILDLLATEGAGWRATGWDTSVEIARYGERPGMIKEKIDAIVERSSHDTLAASVQAMGKMARLASMYARDRTTDEEVWLHAKMTNETGERRALVRSIEYEILTPTISATGYAKENQAKARVTIKRDDWEAIASYTANSGEVSTIGGTLAYSSYPGDTRARLWRTALDGRSGSGILDTFWLGIRSEDKHGVNGITHFESVWDCEDGDNLSGGDCSDVADADAHGGTTVRCTFATNPGWYKRWLLRVAQVSAYEQWQAGRYLMLLRCRVGSATTVELCAITGWILSNSTRSQNIFTVDDETDYIYKEIGIIEIPVLYPGNYGVGMWARRTAGSGYLYMDCIVMIPIDEAFCKLEDGILAYSSDAIKMYVDARGVIDACQYDGVSPEYLLPFSASNWSLPPGDGLFVVAAQREALQDKDDTFTLEPSGYPRYLSLRGNG